MGQVHYTQEYMRGIKPARLGTPPEDNALLIEPMPNLIYRVIQLFGL